MEGETSRDVLRKAAIFVVLLLTAIMVLAALLPDTRWGYSINCPNHGPRVNPNGACLYR